MKEPLPAPARYAIAVVSGLIALWLCGYLIFVFYHV